MKSQLITVLPGCYGHFSIMITSWKGFSLSLMHRAFLHQESQIGDNHDTKYPDTPIPPRTSLPSSKDHEVKPPHIHCNGGVMMPPPKSTTEASDLLGGQ
ncbi:hypothetical protein QYF36_024258 [Acer negundo]|nr:hypothetical protein QYF36_024258 [Acer negundo]